MVLQCLLCSSDVTSTHLADVLAAMDDVTRDIDILSITLLCYVRLDVTQCVHVITRRLLHVMPRVVRQCLSANSSQVTYVFVII